jgi:two-component system, sensor histidine kinase and response regulator
MKCLIVDDLEENLLALSALLQGSQVEVLRASSGRAALELLLQHDVAVALVDVQMPEMDGFELAELMRGTERTRQVPIIFVTAGAHEPHRLFQGYELGAVDFLYKPINPLILQSKVNVFFQLYQQREQLARQLQDLSETLRMNEMFTAILSHDLRNPLNAVLTGAELLLRTTQDETTRKVSERIRSSGQRMAGLVADILDLARWRLGAGISLAVEPVDLGQLVARVVAEHQPSPSDPRIALELTGDLRGQWDPRRLEQAVSNLLGNAVQHGSETDPVVVHVNGSSAEQLMIRVSNSGALPASVRARLFDPFRARERNGGGQSERGLGLGLYIVQQVVLAHGGRIELEEGSDADRTTFRVELPRQSKVGSRND